MADTKISGLTAATAFADTDEFAINEGGVSKKITGTLLRKALGVTLIAGNSGAANDGAAPSKTWQFLTANATANSTTTLTTVMTTTSLPIGTYWYDYYIVWQSATTTVGVNFAIDYTGTVTRTLMTRLGQTGLNTAADGISDQVITATAGGVAQAWAGRSDAASLGPSTGVDTVNVDQFERIYGLLVVSTSANLLLQHASETATSTQVMADTCLYLHRLA